MTVAAIILIPVCIALAFAVFVADQVILRIKCEAVERGQAHVRDGEWEWKE